MSAGSQTVATAYRVGEEISTVTFVNELLQATDTAYFANDPLARAAAELFELLTGETKAVPGSVASDKPDTPDTVVANALEYMVPYSMDFTGAVRIEVTRTNDAEPDEEATHKRITESADVQRVVELLAQLPKDGGLMKKPAPGLRHDVTAYNADGDAFARVTFYREMLQTEGTGFYPRGYEPAMLDIEQALFQVIKISPTSAAVTGTESV